MFFKKLQDVFPKAEKIKENLKKRYAAEESKRQEEEVSD